MPLKFEFLVAQYLGLGPVLDINTERLTSILLGRNVFVEAP
jgi:hypothetical protein